MKGFTISKQFRFSAAHALDHLEPGRQCANQHGHNYTVEVIMMSSTLSSDSFVRDPIDYRRIELFIRRTFDRKNLNDVLGAEFEDDILNALSIEHMADDLAWEGSSREHDAVEQALRTTTENIAHLIFLRLRSDFPEIVAVKVADNFDSWAEYREDH